MPNEFHYLGQAIYVPICISSYLFALRLANTNRLASWLGVTFAIISNSGTYYWLAFYGRFSFWTIGGILLVYACYHALFAQILRHFLRSQSPCQPWIIAALWTGYEFLKSIGYLGFPWNLLAHPLGQHLILVQHVDITGVWALSFVVAAINAAIAQFYTSNNRIGMLLLLRQISICSLIIGIIILYGAYRIYGEKISVSKYVSAILIQQNSNPWRRGLSPMDLYETQQLTLQALKTATVKPDVIIWSENSLRLPYTNYNYYQTTPAELPFNYFLKKIDTYFLSGIPYRDLSNPTNVYNSVMLIDKQGAPIDYYAKRHLVPLAEHIPFWEIPLVRSFYRNIIGIASTWSMGNRINTMQLPLKDNDMVQFGILICFEDSFPNLGRDLVLQGARLLINLTNNAWSQTNSAQTQHFVAARFRSIETRTALIRSTNSGITTAFDRYGNVLGELPPFQASYLNINVPIYDEDSPLTIYAKFGDWFAWGILFFLLILTIKSFYQIRFKKRLHELEIRIIHM